MKTLVKSLLCAATLALTVTGCEKADNHRSDTEVSPQVLKTFAEQFPGAENVMWSVKGNYAVANFYWTGSRAAIGQTNCSAWFDNSDGAWSMTETEVRFTSLPQAVKEAFEASEYATWQIDNEVDVLYRNGEVEPEVYVLEVKLDGREMDLYYTPDGVLVKSLADAGENYDYGEFIPSAPSAGVDEYIRTHYAAARVIDVDVENGGTEVELLDNGVKRELLFDRNGAWIHTKTEVRRAELPAAVTNAWAASEYAESKSFRLDDADYFETAAEGTFYRLELESRNGDVKIKITPEGELSLYAPTTNESMGLSQLSETFIRENYPGATIQEWDFEKGFLEVEILHEGIKKEIVFNGSEAWIRTSWEVRQNKLPATVISALENSSYASWEFDGADYVQTPEGAWYEIELEEERSDREVTIAVTEEGTFRN